MVLSAVTTAISSIPDLVLALGGSLTTSSGQPRILSHNFQFATDLSLARAIAQMTTPSILVGYMGVQWGNFSGCVLWKHKIEFYLRPANSSAGNGPQLSGPDLWYVLSSAPLGPPLNFPAGLNIRQVSLINNPDPSTNQAGMLQLPEQIKLDFRQDTDLYDLFIGQMVFPEYGDAKYISPF